MKKLLTAAGLAAALLLTGCGASIEKDAAYDDINELVADYNQILDEDCSEVGTDIADSGWHQAPCNRGTVMLFTSDAKRDEIRENNPLSDGERFLQGANWLIIGDQYDVESLHEGLGGEVLS